MKKDEIKKFFAEVPENMMKYFLYGVMTIFIIAEMYGAYLYHTGRI